VSTAALAYEKKWQEEEIKRLISMFLDIQEVVDGELEVVVEALEEDISRIHIHC
jgi:ssDNA-specific exonuclease RecJ